MKKILYTALLTIVLAAFAAAPAFSDAQKIGVVDFERCLTKSKKGASLGNEFRAKREEFGKKVAGKEQELKKMVADFEKQASIMSAEAKTAKKAEFEKKRTEFQNEVEAAEKSMRQASEELSTLVYKDLDGIIKELAKRDGYSLILNSSGVWVLYFDKALDVTDEVIRLYDEKAEKEK